VVKRCVATEVVRRSTSNLHTALTTSTGDLNDATAEGQFVPRNLSTLTSGVFFKKFRRLSKLIALRSGPYFTGDLFAVRAL
jgi:hypothetical protein